jgi:hypothetical protein
LAVGVLSTLVALPACTVIAEAVLGRVPAVEEPAGHIVRSQRRVSAGEVVAADMAMPEAGMTDADKHRLKDRAAVGTRSEVGVPAAGAAAAVGTDGGTARPWSHELHLRCCREQCQAAVWEPAEG